MKAYCLRDKNTNDYYDFVEDDFTGIIDKHCITNSLEYAKKCQKELKCFNWDCEIIEGTIKGEEV